MLIMIIDQCSDKLETRTCCLLRDGRRVKVSCGTRVEAPEHLRRQQRVTLPSEDEQRTRPSLPAPRRLYATSSYVRHHHRYRYQNHHHYHRRQQQQQQHMRLLCSYQKHKRAQYVTKANRVLPCQSSLYIRRDETNRNRKQNCYIHLTSGQAYILVTKSQKTH